MRTFSPSVILMLCSLAVDPVLASESPAAQSTNHSSKHSAAPRPSEQRVQIISDQTITNRITRMASAAEMSRYQVRLESARKLREGKELKRAESTLIQILESDPSEEIKRPALLELGLVMQEQQEFPKAQQIYTEYIRRFENDPTIPEVLLRQAYLYREMGVSVMALSKFYAVISTCLNLKLEEVEYYQRLVLRAQAEIAETHYLQGQYNDAIDYLNRLLKLETEDLERANVLFKLVQCHARLNETDLVIGIARLFLEKFSARMDAAETRFLLVEALKKLGRNEEAIAEIDLLLKTQQAEAKADPQQWLYWQQRAGNSLANEFYREGDYMTALHVYQTLSEINTTPEWQMPVWYQIGLIYEHLKQPEKAVESYTKILSREKDVKSPSPNLKAVAEMAAWRKQNIDWEETARQVNRRLAESTNPSELAATER